MSQNIPDSAITIRTYEELGDFARNFAKGAINMLGVVGTAGLAKSQTMEHVMKKSGQPHVTVKGHSTAFILYQTLYLHRDEPVIIDDVDTLYDDRKTRPLLKCVCETTKKKMIQWQSKSIDDDAIPRKFETTSRVCILCNEWRTVSNNMRAVADRGHFLNFTPSVHEVHRQVATWIPDAQREVFEFIGEHLGIVTTPSMRYYVKGIELRKCFPERWKDLTLNMLNPDLDRKALEILSKLLADTQLSARQRVNMWTKATGMSRATFFRYQKLFKDTR